MTRVLDDWISHTAPRLANLPRGLFALFFAYVAERLIPLYVAFEKKHAWGDSAVVRSRLDGIWNVLEGVSTGSPRGTLARLEALAPSGEEFDSPDSTYAQDAVICVDAAARALTPSEELDGDWIEYAIEPIKTKVAIEQSGYSSMEGDAAADWEVHLMRDPRVAGFLRDCESLISRLEAATVPPVGELRAEARSKSLPPEEYIPVQLAAEP